MELSLLAVFVPQHESSKEQKLWGEIFPQLELLCQGMNGLGSKKSTS